MKWLISKFKGAKWLAWAGLGVVAVVILFIVRGLFSGPKTPGKRLPEVPNALKEKVEKAEEGALIARVEARVKAEEATKELEEIAAVDDGAERRKRLAEMLNGL